MNYFFITGLPRSGTAWIANYLSYGNVLCLHDGFTRVSTPAKMKEFFDQSGAYVAGNSGPENLWLYKDITKVFPEAKWVIITRPKKDVEESCKKLNFPIADLGEALKQIPDTAMKVPFSQLFDKADEIGRFIYEDWESPKWRHDMLKKTNVQLNWDKVADGFHIPNYVLGNTEITTPTGAKYLEALGQVTNNDPNILRFLEQSRDAADLYQRIVEKKPIDIGRAKGVIEAMAFEWILNPFVRAQAVVLASAMAGCLSKYSESKSFHSCPVEVELPAVVSFLLGGYPKMNEDIPKLKELAKEMYQEKLRRVQ